MALLLLVEPVFDALRVKDVCGVALQLARLALFGELFHADGALVGLSSFFVGFVVPVVFQVFHHR